MCEFQYNYLLDDGTAVWATGVVRMRECSGDLDEEYVVSDMDFRGKEYGRQCHECTRTKQRPMYHKMDIHDGKPTECPYGGSSKGNGRSRLPAVPVRKGMLPPKPKAARGTPNVPKKSANKKGEKKEDKPTNKKAQKKEDKPTDKKGKEKEDKKRQNKKTKDKAKKKNTKKESAEDADAEDADIPSAASGMRMSELDRIWENARKRGSDVYPAKSRNAAADDDAAAATTADDELYAATGEDNDDDAAAAASLDDLDADLEDDGTGDDDDDASSVCDEVKTEVHSIVGNCWEFDKEPPLCLYKLRWAGYTAKYDTFQEEDSVPEWLLTNYKASRKFESLKAARKRHLKKTKPTNTGRKRGRPIAPNQENAPTSCEGNAYEELVRVRKAENQAKFQEFLGSNPVRIEMAEQQPRRAYQKRNVAESAPSSMNLRTARPRDGNGP